MRHTPICGHTRARSDRVWKRIWHRSYRHRTRQQVRLGLEPVSIRGYGPANVYVSQKDGKHWFGDRHPYRYQGYWIRRLGSMEAYEMWWRNVTAKMLRK